MIVADGLGGMEGGDRASRFVASELPSLYLSDQGSDPLEALLNALHEVNRRVCEIEKDSPNERRMGTTLVAAAIMAKVVHIANVGDSRAYSFHEDRLRQLSVDHTLSRPFFVPFVHQRERLSHVLTQAIGPRPTISPFATTAHVDHGEVLMLCSNGLTSFVSDKEIQRVIAEQPFDCIPLVLRDRVYELDGDDDISIIVARIVQPDIQRLEGHWLNIGFIVLVLPRPSTRGIFSVRCAYGRRQ